LPCQGEADFEYDYLFKNPDFNLDNENIVQGARYSSSLAETWVGFTRSSEYSPESMEKMNSREGREFHNGPCWNVGE